MRPRSQARACCRDSRPLSLLVSVCLCLGACTDDGQKNGDPPPGPYPYYTYLHTIRDVDLLFVIDNSSSMADEQEMLRAQFTALVQALRSTKIGLPNLHLGVTTTDLGTSPYPITFCEQAGGDGGRLLTGQCVNPTGVPYVVDVEPLGCETTQDATGGCATHTCEASHCAHEPSTTLVVDSTTGCPRCRNYSGEDLEDVFSCIASVGTQGCGFEQPLEAMYKALEFANTANHGFLRETSFLAVLFITDEDDCSASNPQIFDNSNTDIDSPLGPLASFRCFEFGVTCDQTGRDPGLRTGCLPREDSGALLHFVSRYVSFLGSMKDPLMLVVSAIAGPTADQEVTVGLDENSFPAVESSCTGGYGVAVPGIRLRALVEAFNPAEDLEWAYTSICSPTYTFALEGLGQRISESLQADCLPSPLQACADPGAEYDRPNDAYAGNDQCLASCHITDIFRRGTLEETQAEVPPCLEVCPSGACPGNTDRSLAYVQGHPNARDPSLPVSACWHVGYSEICERANHAEIVVSRREDPPPRSFASTSCMLIPETEQRCADGEDNDEDGLVDLDDPDCAQEP